MRNSHDRPQRFCLSLSFVGLILSVPHLFCILFEDLIESIEKWRFKKLHSYLFYVFIALRRRFGSGRSDLWHTIVVVGIEPDLPYISKSAFLPSLCPPQAVSPVILTFIWLPYTACKTALVGLYTACFGLKQSSGKTSLFCPLTNDQHAVIRSNPPPSYALFEHL